MVRATTILILAALLGGCSALPERDEERQTAAAPSPARSLPAARSASAGQCLARLGQLGASYTPLPDRYLDRGCTNLNTVQLAGLTADRASLAVTNLGPVTCEVSQAFAGWARYGADRAARQILGAGLRSIETFGSYSCRDVAGSGRRSAHASAAAIDISGFVLEDGRRITVKSGWRGGSAKEREFLRVVQSTVLGPEYNSAHEDHLHLEGVIGTKSYCR